MRRNRRAGSVSGIPASGIGRGTIPGPFGAQGQGATPAGPTPRTRSVESEVNSWSQ